MNFSIMKKHYIKPTLEETLLELQGVIAVSNPEEVKIYDDITDADAKMGNKKGEFWSHTWE
jgi:hypothetical protein